MIRIDGLRPAALGLTLAVLLSACTTPPLLQGPPEITALPPPAIQTPPPVSPRVAALAESLTRMAALQERLYRVAAPLLINNAELCKNSARNLLAFTAKNRFSYGGDLNEAAHVAFGMNDRLQVTGVLAGSGAARAGLHRGDRLLSVGGKPVPTGPNALPLAGAIFGPLIASQSTLAFVVERDGAERQIGIPVTRACGYNVELGNTDYVNSYADGARVLVTRGMINFTRGDSELAYPLAKGIAHNILAHAAMQRNAGTISDVIENLVRVQPDLNQLITGGGIKAMPQDLDAAADRLSLYLLARAGYDIEGVDDFWKRLAATYPASVLTGYVANHPATAFRLAAIEKAAAEVKAKQAAKKPLVP
ncbi:MAG: M48 family metallopeptidase [Massilia sp.]